LAEPALNALGATVEEITVGTFKKSLLMQAVAVGVGFGIAFGVSKIMFDIPLIVMCGPPYLVLLVITLFSTEEFVNIGCSQGLHTDTLLAHGGLTNAQHIA
jgi:hypothetical protein